ncbi:MAG: hypothetical protein R2873_16410 [Caldilineaceae bacterium]
MTRCWAITVASNSGSWTCRRARALRDAAGFERTLGMAAATDMARYGGNTGLHWLPDGDRIVALVSDAGTVHPCAIDVADGAVSPITAGDFVTAAYSLDDAGQRMAMLLRDGSTPGDIFVVDLAGPLPVAQHGSQTSTVRS